jgi:MinD-like ATPase involved in chromosome partitioning or flagellar assembly
MFMMIVNMPNNPQTAREMKERYKEQALQMLKAALQRIREDYQEQHEGKTIKLKMVDRSVTEGLEYLTNAQYRPTLQAYYRLQCLVEID